MEFRDLSDAAALMGEAAAALRPGTPLRGDFTFFRAINCTTQSEYREELKGFLEALLAGPAPLPEELGPFVSRLAHLCRWL